MTLSPPRPPADRDPGTSSPRRHRTAADQNARREHAEAVRAFLSSPVVLGALVGIFLALLVIVA